MLYRPRRHRGWSAFSWRMPLVAVVVGRSEKGLFSCLSCTQPPADSGPPWVGLASQRLSLQPPGSQDLAADIHLSWMGATLRMREHH